MHSRRTSRHLGALRATAFLLGLSFFSACHDSGSLSGPRPFSPVGRYELIGCTYSDTLAAHIEADCVAGLEGVTQWDSGTLLLDDDGTVTRTFVTTFSTPYEPIPRSITDTAVVQGRWTRDGREITAVWTNLSYAASTTYTRVDWDVLRAGGNDFSHTYFWYRRKR